MNKVIPSGHLKGVSDFFMSIRLQYKGRYSEARGYATFTHLDIFCDDRTYRFYTNGYGHNAVDVKLKSDLDRVVEELENAGYKRI